MQSPSRYDRQIRFHGIGDVGQSRIANAVVAIVGCGALGSVAAEILARSGVGNLRLIDRDTVELTNLQRQALYNESDAKLGLAKVHAAKNALAKINSEINVIGHAVELNCDNAAELLCDCDLIMDGGDNFPLRFLINDYCLQSKTAWVHGGCVGVTGQVMLFTGRQGPCFRCIIPDPPPPSVVETCDTAGVLGPATHSIAAFQSMLALRHLASEDDQRGEFPRVLSVDFWNQHFRDFELPRMPNCPACVDRDYEFLEGRHQSMQSAKKLCGRDAVQIPGGETINLDEMRDRWSALGEVQFNPFFVRLKLSVSQSITLFRDGRAVVDGTDDIAAAQTLYDRYVGR